jgi:hypothetical protein
MDGQAPSGGENNLCRGNCGKDGFQRFHASWHENRTRRHDQSIGHKHTVNIKKNDGRHESTFFAAKAAVESTPPKSENRVDGEHRVLFFDFLTRTAEAFFAEFGEDRCR